MPFDPVRQYVSQRVSEPPMLKIFPGADGEFTLYDDDGASQGYLHAADLKTVWIHCQWNDATHQLTLEPDARMKSWNGAPRQFRLQLIGGQREPVEVSFQGRRIVIRLPR